MDETRFDPGSRSRLTPRDLPRFAGATLFERAARAVCRAGCLPRKELYESWEVARRARRRFRGGRVVDLAGGHGLIAWLMVILDDTSPTALAVDTRRPDSVDPLARELLADWPRLADRVAHVTGDLAAVPLASTDVIVSAHACGALTDVVLARAVGARARLAVLPCCHDEATCDLGGLGGWLDPSLAIDATRVARLRAAGYAVHTQVIPAAITPKNRLLLAEPPRTPGSL
ncbi:MAG: methyltransferase domain-containing protein [Myxococcales bacterium]|nr:MAG: methyltransferase domain-containing protein [Myxococcales bacterium]